MSAEPPQKAPFDLQGHRGARGLRPENTLAAFAHALSLGVTTLELDCGVTRDGVVVVSHDSELNPDHTRDAAGNFLEKTGPGLFSITYDDLRKYDVGRLKPGTAYAMRHPEQEAKDGERIPQLADVFALVKKAGNGAVRFNIETKLYPARPELTLPPQPFAEAVIKVIREAGMQSRSTIQSFDWRTLKIVQKIAPDVATVALTTQRSAADDNIQIGKPGPSLWLAGLDVDDFGGSVPKVVKASGAFVWSPNYLDIDQRLVDEAHGLGLHVIPWTINDRADLEQILALGVDGIISDYPDRLRSVVGARGLALPAPTSIR